MTNKIQSFQSRKYQLEAVNKALNSYKEKLPSVLINSPVGSGKTFMGLMVIKELQKQAAIYGKSLRVNWVAARKHILSQTEEINNKFFNCDINYVSFFNKEPPVADMLVIDEAHHEATQSVIDMYENSKNAITLGLSATPMRTDRMKLSFRTEIKTVSIMELVSLGYLANVHSYKIKHYSAPIVANIYVNFRELFGKSIAFFKTIRECEEFSRILNSQGIVCEVVTGKSDKDLQIEKFANGQIDVIANVSVLTEGFDVPDLKTVFIRDASRVPTIQMAGRGLRKTEGKEICNIVQSEKTKYHVEKIVKPLKRYSYIEDHWRLVTETQNMIEKFVSIYTKNIQNQTARHHVIVNQNNKIYYRFMGEPMSF